MGDRDIFKSDVELLGTLEEISSDAVADGLTLSDKFGGVKLSYYGFKDFVANGWKDTLIVILSEALFIEFSSYVIIYLSGIILGRSLAAS